MQVFPSLSSNYVCARCAFRKHASLSASRSRWRSSASKQSALLQLSHTTPYTVTRTRTYTTKNDSNSPDNVPEQKKEERHGSGAMSERLARMSEDALEASPGSAAKNVEDAGFSEGLRRQLEDRIAGANFRSENASALAQANLPRSASNQTRDIAATPHWTGEERLEDAALRMLNDAHKPLRGAPRGTRAPAPAARLPSRIDSGRNTKGSAGARIARAREQSSLYGAITDSGLSKEEQEARRQEMKARFEPNARAVVPGTIQGIASLANKRIEDAVARGQFKNLPRGQKIERDYTASSPFLDTTEYFMNKIIQRQEIVPPWIEAQQEILSEARKFRARLRNDWKRHASRVIASEGGSLEDQMTKARQYAEAELRVNPQAKKEERMNTVGADGQISQISLSGELQIPQGEQGAPLEEKILVSETVVEATSAPPPVPSPSSPTSDDVAHQTEPIAEAQVTIESPPAPSSPSLDAPSIPTPTSTPFSHPFRDPTYLATEASYHRAFITSINNKLRSYNLQAPRVAQKPYLNLDRELNSMYADVAPELAAYIRARALAPKAKATVMIDATGAGKGVLGGLMGEGRVRIRDERKDKEYGLKQFWKDLWSPKDA